MPQFESKGPGVVVKDDNGTILGVAHPYGQALTSEAALAQVGYQADSNAPSGVRRIGADAPAAPAAKTATPRPSRAKRSGS